MVYDWVQGWTLYSLVLKNIDVQNNFWTELFPEFKVTDMTVIPDTRQEFIALYNMDIHEIWFAENAMYKDNFWFSQVYFHELIHSTTKFNNRIGRIGLKNKNHTTIFRNLLNLEERIADIGALILCQSFETHRLDTKKMLESYLAINPTEYALPWGEIEAAVYCYVKNKHIPNVKKQLQLVKDVITQNNMTPVYEGSFDGR